MFWLPIDKSYWGGWLKIQLPSQYENTIECVTVMPSCMSYFSMQEMLLDHSLSVIKQILHLIWSFQKTRAQERPSLGVSWFACRNKRSTTRKHLWQDFCAQGPILTATNTGITAGWRDKTGLPWVSFYSERPPYRSKTCPLQYARGALALVPLNNSDCLWKNILSLSHILACLPGHGQLKIRTPLSIFWYFLESF